MCLLKFVLACSSLVLFWACSQTVSGSDDGGGKTSTDHVPGFGTLPTDSSANSGDGSGVGGDGRIGDNADGGQNAGAGDWGGNWDDDFFGSNQGSDFDFTQYVPEKKFDCDFTVDDDKWEIDYQTTDTTVNAVFEYKPDGYMWSTVSEAVKMQDSQECEENYAMMEFVMMLMEAAAQEQGRDDIKVSANCEGALLTVDFAGRTEEKVTAEERQKAYERICN